MVQLSLVKICKSSVMHSKIDKRVLFGEYPVSETCYLLEGHSGLHLVIEDTPMGASVVMAWKD